MPDPVPGAPVIPAAPVPAAAPAAPKPAVTPAPVPAAQPTPAAVTRTGAPAAPIVPAAPAPGQVPLASLMEEREKRQALQTELESLRNTVTQIQQRQQPAPGFQGIDQQQIANQQQANMKAQLDQLWQTDPRKAVQTEILMANQWTDNVNAQVDSEAEGLAGKYADFNDYRNTAMRYVRALPLDQRARPGIVEMAYLVTRGQNVDKIIEAQRQVMAAQFQQNPAQFQMPAGLSASLTTSNQVQATDAEIRAAGAMRVPIEDYLKWKK